MSDEVAVDVGTPLCSELFDNCTTILYFLNWVDVVCLDSMNFRISLSLSLPLKFVLVGRDSASKNA